MRPGGFNEAFYLWKYPNAAALGTNPLQHDQRRGPVADRARLMGPRHKAGWLDVKPTAYPTRHSVT